MGLVHRSIIIINSCIFTTTINVLLITAWREVSKSKSPWPTKVKVDPPKVPERMKKQRKEEMKKNGKLQDVGGQRFKVFTIKY